ncbi:sensor histidine kinase [Saccharothrix variisporea]|uniref:Two-component system sensor histidine kinase DesK n=1 Tax=Saccharothrix variisporea TaxID=543527 RepID=A0A495XMF3_9PSEU|nr:histidine kinase [Saccharothrix variisporea]RKT74084.1 two-component system sensor histidine kinase DesK [Saccharothrix variisporea]
MRDKHRWWAFGLVFVLLYVPAVAWDLAGRTDRPLWWRVLTIALLLAYAVSWLALPVVLRFQDGDVGRRTVFCVALTVLGLVVVGLVGLDEAGLMVYVMASTAIVLPAWRAIAIDGAVLAVLVGALVVEGRFPDAQASLGTLLSVSLGMLAVGRMIRANRALDLAQEEIAALAVTAERNRLARDLHDILGHSLTTITLKAGVARRLLESDERDRAYDEVREIENLTRQALGDVRATVSGYREVSLSAEVVGAREALRAAGVRADLPHAVDNVRPDLQRVFGYVLREAVTNVLRHAAATRCEVRLGDTWLEVRDNGRGHGAGTPGTGLTGLSERLAEVGGRVVAGPLAGGGYRVRAEVA